MNIILYNTKSTNNTIGKVLTDETTTEIKLKDNTDIKSPIVIMKFDTFPTFNYCYLDDFHRFYFINNIESFPNKIYRLSLSIDVLETYKDDIKASSGFIAKQTNINPYYNTAYESEIKKQIDKYESDKSIVTDARTRILITLGGV